uniref:Uncharacterized protein n=1 Tax=Cannabis sativa TaxID=3483 RepID=A0A803RC48_CANSA
MNMAFLIQILVEYKSKYPNHVECAKALELYLPCLRDYVKSNYSLGQVWSSTGKAVTAASSKAPRPSAPAPPPLCQHLFLHLNLLIHHHQQVVSKGCLLSSKKLILGSL